MFRWTYDPHPTHVFEVELDGEMLGSFLEVGGLSVQAEVQSFNEGGSTGSIGVVTRTTYGDITLKRGFLNDPALFDWIDQTAINSNSLRKNGAIIMKGDHGEEVCRWKFFKALPIKWEGVAFNSTSSAIAIESVTLAIEWLELELGQPPEDSGG